MTIDESFARLEAGCRAGDYRAAAECFDLCHANGRPIPDWLAPLVRQAMAFAAHRINAEGAPGRGKTGSYAKQWDNLDKPKMRHALAKQALAMLESGELAGWIGKSKATKADAYAWASDRLKGSKAWGNAERIARDYRAIERAKTAANSAN